MDYTKDYTKLTQQMTGFYKSTIDNSINAITMIQENTEKMVSLSLNQSPWFPEEGKKFVSAWMEVYRKGSDNLKAAADEQYRKLESFINLQQRADSAEKPEAAKAEKAHKPS